MFIDTSLDKYYENQDSMVEEELMRILGRKRCNICNCWVYNFKRHLLTKSHFNAVMNNLKPNNDV
jgi:hypothetical protein